MNAQIIDLIKGGVLETFYMVILSTAFAYLIGVPMGVILNITSPTGIKPNRVINLVVGFITNVIRSVPFLILLVAILPFTRFIVGTTIGSTATVVPLVVAAAPFVARLVESSLKEVDSGVIEAAKAMEERRKHAQEEMTEDEPEQKRGKSKRKADKKRRR